MLSKFDQSKPMINLIGGDNEHFVTCLGSVKNRFGDDLPTVDNESGDKMVNVQFLDVLGYHRIIDIVACCFKDFSHLDNESLKSVIAFHIDGDNTNRHAGNLGYRFKNDKLEVPKFAGYYYVPGFPRRAINKNGELLSTKKFEKLTWYITKPQTLKKATGGYYTNRVEVKGKGFTLLRHRAMLLVFKGYPDNVDDLLSNHINGVPGDDIDLTNLEWVNYSRNLEHSYQANLRTQNKPVVARNVLTGEEKFYISVADCGRDLNINDRSINDRLEKRKFSSVTRDGFQFKYLDESRDWIIPDDPEQAIQDAIQAQAVIVTDASGKEQLCKSIGMAKILTGISYYKISNAVKRIGSSDIDEFNFRAAD